MEGWITLDSALQTWYLAIDDTDGPSGGCTTYTASRIIDHLRNTGCRIVGYPRLIRLNPNVPFKTRGNGALAIIFRSRSSRKNLEDTIKQIINEDTQDRIEPEQAQPCALLMNKVPDSSIYTVALNRLLDYKDYIGVYNKYSILGSPSRGLIGTLAAICADLSFDKTYELIAYRKRDNLGKERVVSNVREIAEKYPRATFSTYDFEQERELIAPSGPDPVYFGIRGDNPHALIEIFTKLELGEEVESYTIFETNQATDAHVLRPQTEMESYRVISSLCTVSGQPKIRQGGHVKVSVRLDDRDITLMCFEPTKQLARAVTHLRQGDIIYIHGACKDQDTVSLEQMMAVELSPREERRPPLCTCGKRMISAGFLKGYKCKSCSSKTWEPQITEVEPKLVEGVTYYASASAQRHLTRPPSRQLKRNRQSYTPVDFRKVFSES